MALVINTNMASLTAQRNLSSSQSDYNTSLERLSSGLRINSAKDDAAGLAISTRFESQITGLDQAVRNANDGVSLAQTAEGALDSMTDNLQRIRELAVQASNSTNSDDDRVALQAEVEQLLEEITRTAEETTFNGQNLLDGTFDGVFQVGADAGQTVSFSISELTAGQLGTSSTAGVSAQGTDSALENGDLVINGVSIDASVAADDSASTDNAAASAIAKAAAINAVSSETGVEATVDTNEVNGTVMDASSMSGTISINGVDISIQTTDDETSSRSSVVAAINAVADQTGVTAVDSDSDANGVQLMAEDGRNIQIEFGTDFGETDADIAAATGLATEGTYTGGYTLTAQDGTDEIVITGGNGTGNGDLANAGLAEGTYSAGVSTVTSTVQTVSSGGEGSISLTATNAGASIGALPAGETLTVSVNGESTSLGSVTDAASLATALNENVDGIEAVAINEVVISAGGAALTFGSGTEALQLGDGSGGNLGSAYATASYSSASAMAAAMNADSALSAAGYTFEGNDAAGTISIFQEDGDTIQFGAGVAGGIDAQARLANGGLSAVTAAADDEGSVGFVQINSTDTDVTSLSLSSGTASSNLLGTTAANELVQYDLSTVPSNGLEDGDMVIEGVTIGASSATDDTASDETAYSSNAAASGIAIAAAINEASDATGVTAEVNETVVVGGTATTAGIAGSEGDIYINNVNVGTITLTGDADADRTTAIDMINQYSGQTGVTAEDNGESITLTAADGRNVSVAIDNRFAETAASISGGSASVTASANTLADTADTLNFSGNGDDATFDVTYTNDYGVDTTVTIDLSAGNYDSDSGSNIAGLAAAVNTALTDAGLGDYVTATMATGATPLTFTEDLNLGGTITISNISSDIAGAGELFATADEGATDTGTAGTVGSLFTGANVGLDSTVDGIGEGDITYNSASSYAAVAETTYSTVTLSAASSFEVESGTSGDEGLTDSGFSMGTFGGGEDGTYLSDIDISTFEGAQAAIVAIDNALDVVTSQQAELGAIQNRFESTVMNLEVTQENLTAAQSAIQDADFAEETAEMTRTSVLQQAGISVLSQANAQSQNVLSLLG
jgi:flagellin